MKPRLHHLYKMSVFVVVVCLLCLCIGAQTPPQPAATVGTGTISGRATSNDRPLAGIPIALMSVQPSGAFGRVALARAETDAEGRYQLTGVPAGSYTVVSLAPLYVSPALTSGLQFGNIPGKQVTLNDGETVTGIDLVLVRGGVITGRVTDIDNRPIIEQFVQLDRLDQNNNPMPVMSITGLVDSMTDDRGIYRVYGLPPGRYRASSGDGEGSFFRLPGRKTYPRTFYPDVSDATQAKIIDISEGSEASGIDIRISQPAKTYAVLGRAVDADTGDGVSGVRISYNILRIDGRTSGMGGGSTTGPNGEFRIDGMRSGRYTISAGGNELMVTAAGGVSAGSGGNGYSDPVPVEVMEGDVSGIELRVRRGGSVTGVVVIEGSNDPAVLAKLSQIMLFGFVRPTDGAMPMPSVNQSRVGADRVFRFEGLRPGKFQINVSNSGSSDGNLTLLRIERDGVVQRPDGIEVGPGEQVGGVRLVFVFGNSVVRGQVNTVNGTLPEGSFLTITARRTEGNAWMMGPPARADGRGQFVLEGLAPGQYELEARIGFMGPSPPGVRRRFPTAKLPIVVTNGQVQQVTLTLDLAQQEPRQ